MRNGLRKDWACSFAARHLDEKPTVFNPKLLEKDLKFVGMTGMIDPPPEEVTNVIPDCRCAGITPVMITGYQALIADAIATRLNMHGGKQCSSH